MDVLDHVGRRGAQRVGDHLHLRVLERDLDLGCGRRLGPAEQLQGVAVAVLDRHAVVGEDLLPEVKVLLGHHLAQRLGQLLRGQVRVHALVLVGDDDVDAVGVVADVLVDPVELDLELLRREADGPEHAEPPALLTATTTSRQWVKAKIGNSMPSSSQIGVCITTPGMLAELERVLV